MSKLETTIYEDLIAAGVKTDSHESDLYFEATPAAREIMRRRGLINRTGQRRAEGQSFQFFRSEIDGKVWVDVPFSFDPWWHKRRIGHGERSP